jgi:hypothetical protein
MFRSSILAVALAAVIAFLVTGTVAGQSGFVPGCAAPSFPAPGPTGIDQGCPIEGSGGAEAGQNTAKNNFCAGGPPVPITVDDLVTLQTNVQSDKRINFGNDRDHPLSNAPGPAANRTPLRTLGEGTLRTLQGFVFTARQERKESVNCGTAVSDSPPFHDLQVRGLSIGSLHRAG